MYTNTRIAGIPFHYTGKFYGDNGKFFTLTIWDGKEKKESEPFVQVDSFPKRITLPMFKHFLGEEANSWISFFGEKIIKRNLKYISPRDFLAVSFVEDGYDRESPIYSANSNYFYGNIKWKKGWVLGKRKSFTCKEYRGEWERSYTGYGYDILHLSSYSCWRKKFTEKCLVTKFRYLKEFDFDAYGTSEKGGAELYLKVKGGSSLYVPLKALQDNDFSVIENRMKTYFSWYYGGESRKPYYDKEMALLVSPEADRLKAIFKDNRNEKED